MFYTESQGNDRYTVIAPDSITLLGKNREPIVTIESKYMDKTVLIQNEMEAIQQFGSFSKISRRLSE